MSKDKKQTIKCDVDTCKFNNTDDKLCELDEIKVSCICDSDDCRSTDETICDSFEEKDIDFDDEEYQEELIDNDEFEEDGTDDDEDEESEDEFVIEEYVEIEEE